MRSLLCLAALAALACTVSAGPVRYASGCFATDTIPHYGIKDAAFVDGVKKNFVDQAYVQARKRAAALLEERLPEICEHTGHAPVRACYNSVIPGTLGAPQIGGQYGFHFNVYFLCGKKVITRSCRARINSLRGNREGAPDFWDAPNVKCP